MKMFRITTVLVAISFLVVTNVNAQFTSKAAQVIEFVVPSGLYTGEVFIIAQPGEDINDLFAAGGIASAFMNKQETLPSIPSKSGLTKAEVIVTTSGGLMKGSFSVQKQLTLVLEDGTSYVVSSEIEELKLEIHKSCVNSVLEKLAEKLEI